MIPERAIRAWAARLGVFIVAVVLLRMGFELWWVGRIHEHLWVQVLVALYYLGGLTFLLLSAMKIDHERLDYVGFFVLLQALAYYAVITITVVNVHYTSDALLFVHQAAAELLAGNNPYAVDLVGGYDAFQVPYYVQTPTTTGGLVTNLNYPALSVLLYVPFVAVGLPDLRPVSLGFLVALLGLLFLSVPRHLRLLIPSLLFLSSFFVAFTISGFDILFVYFLLSAMIFWDGRPRDAMVFFGLACAVKQTAWFVAPFLLVGLWIETRGRPTRERAWEVAVASSRGLLAFLVPNLPFILWDPGAWLAGVLTPFGLAADSLVPLSQGLTVFMYTGAVRVDAFLLHLLAGSVLLALLGAYALRYERLRDVAWIVPPIVLAFSDRALQNYFEMFYPIGLYAVLKAYPLLGTADPPASPSRAPAPPEAGSPDAAASAPVVALAAAPEADA